MSVSAVAHGVIGVRVAVSSDMFGTERRLSCSHTHVVSSRNWEPNHISNLKFCPECGKPVKDVKKKFSQFEEIGEFENHLEEALKQFPEHKWHIASNHFWDNEHNLCIGIGGEVGEYDDGHHFSIKLPPEDAVKAALKTVLEPFGLYDERSYGLHVILYYG